MTRKLCPKPQMTAEDAFLTSLRSAKRWRVDGAGSSSKATRRGC